MATEPLTTSHELSWPPGLVEFGPDDADLVNGMTAHVHSVDCPSLHQLFGSLFHVKQAAGLHHEASVLHLLAGIAHMVLRPSDRGHEWGPRQVTTEYRSPMPADIRGPQTQGLAQIARGITHPGLRARLADLAWTNDRKLGASATLAFDSYCDCAERLLDGRAHPGHGLAELTLSEAIQYIERATVLDYVTRGRRKPQSQRIVELIRSIYSLARDRPEINIFKKASELGLESKILAVGEIAIDAETVAEAIERGPKAFVIKVVLDFAAYMYGLAGDSESKRRCQLAAVDQALAMRQHVSTPGAQAHWIQTALFALRDIRDTDEKRRELRQELRYMQEDSLNQMMEFSVPLDLEERQGRVQAAFDNLSLSDSLLALACISKSRSIEGLEQQARRSLDEHALRASFGVEYLDGDGMTSAQTSGTDVDGESERGQLMATIEQHEGMRRHIVVVGSFEPARLSIIGKFDICEQDILPIVEQSPFVRREQVGLFSLGFTRLLQGDFRSAVHLLVPQMESSLRYILRLAGSDTAREYDDMTEENIGLEKILVGLREELEKIIHPDIIMEIELLFHYKTGNKFRHNLAHGLLGAGGCYAPDAIYACWLLYHLTCIPLIKDWNQLVSVHFTYR